MSLDAPTPQDVADYLSQNPRFFEDHADIFATLHVPHPYQGRAISLGERQVMTLRSRMKEQEQRLMQLMHHAGGNERLSQALMLWCARMLAEPQADQIPAHIIRHLSDQFDLDAIALRTWNLAGLQDSEFAQDVTPEIRLYAAGLQTPYCGPLKDQEAATWLASEPASLAILPLRTLDGPDPIGLLVLGSADPQRYTADMATDFLSQISALAGAALGRLAYNTPQTA